MSICVVRMQNPMSNILLLIRGIKHFQLKKNNSLLNKVTVFQEKYSLGNSFSKNYNKQMT